jgi:hypothetical protein
MKSEEQVLRLPDDESNKPQPYRHARFGGRGYA